MGRLVTYPGNTLTPFLTCTGFLYLYFYLNAKLKVFSNYHPAMWKILATYAPVLGAFLITGSLTIDEYHNWYDCLAGAVIGSVMAISAYRMVYASVWDFRFNHIPLTRHTPFSFGAGAAGAGGFETAVFTRKAGWGYEEAYGGAPFDAATHLRGAQAGFNTDAVDNHGHGTHGGHGAHGTQDTNGSYSSTHGTHGLTGTTGTTGMTGTHGTHSNHGLTGTHGTHNNHGLTGTTGTTGTYGTHGTHGTHGLTGTTGTHDTYGTNNSMYSQGTHAPGTHNLTGTHHGGLGHRDGDIEHHAGVTQPAPVEGDQRYRVHSRSLERKALNRNSGGL